MIKFREIDHRYESVTPDSIKWKGVTTSIGLFKEKFDNSISKKNSIDPNSKWFGIAPEEILKIWDTERIRSTDLGSWWHKKMEDKEETNPRTIHCCPIKDDWKYAGTQILKDGLYPEFITYNAEFGICGQADRVDVLDNVINIQDWKTNKEIKMRSFRGKKMLYELSHLEDCHLIHYTLQMSMYLWMLLQHNPNMKPGKLTLYHVKFEEDYKDQYGYPVYKIENGDYLVKEIVPIEVPYLEKEVISIIHSLQ